MQKESDIEILQISGARRQLVLTSAWLKEHIGIDDDCKYVVAQTLPSGAVVLAPFKPEDIMSGHLAFLKDGHPKEHDDSVE
jgi:hypothetical protein